jgi:phage shock protein A
MNLLERVLTLLRANVNTMMEKADDPEKVLRQLQQDMRNQLVQVKTQVATAIAESHKLQHRSKEKATEAESWLKKAEQAIQQNNDATARAHLGHYNDMLKQAQRYQQQQKEQEQLVATMRGVLSQLEAKLAEVETTIDLLIARKRNALIQQRVFDALNKTGGTKEKERAAKAQDAVLEAEARARALAELHKNDLDVQLNQLTQEQFIEQQMNELKAKYNGTQRTGQEKKTGSSEKKLEIPLLPEGNPHPSPLIPPQPQLHEPARKRAEGKSKQETSRTRPVPSTQSEVDTESVANIAGIADIADIVDIADIAERKKLMD